MDVFNSEFESFKLLKNKINYDSEFCELFYAFFCLHFSAFQKYRDRDNVGIINPCARMGALLLNVSVGNIGYDFIVKLFPKPYFGYLPNISMTSEQENQIKEFLADLDLDWEI